MNIDYTAMFNQLGQQIVTLAESTISEYRDAAVADANKLVNMMKDDLTRWGTLLANGQLKPNDLQLLVANGKTLMTLTALEEAGLTQIRLDQFMSGLLNLIYNTLLSFITSLTKTL